MFQVGDVVQNNTKSFNQLYPNHTGVVEAVKVARNGTFYQVEYTAEVESMPARSRKIAVANGAPLDGWTVFTAPNEAGRSLTEIV